MRLKKTLLNFLPYGLVVKYFNYKKTKLIQRAVSDRLKSLNAIKISFDVGDKKLINFGCGKHYQPGWINIDYEDNGDINFNFCKDSILPFENNSIDGVFSEHFLEHVDFETGYHFLEEAFRVLKVGGVLRTCCPDLGFLLDGLNEEKFLRMKEMFIAVGDFNKLPEDILNAEVVNWMFYGHGHRFIYDYETLSSQIKKAGFSVVEKKEYGESMRPYMVIERRYQENFYSLTVDAIK